MNILLRQKLYSLVIGAVFFTWLLVPPVASAASLNAVLESYDPGFTANSQNVDRQWALPKINATAAWNITTGSNLVVVAIIDTGIDETHEDLRKASFVTGYDFITQTDILPGTDSDENGHGTLVAGVLAATPNNGVGVVGVNWQVSIMPLKALNAGGEGSSEDISKAIRYAVDHNANIINLSLGGVGFGQDIELANAVRYAYEHNVVIVAAAGNDVAAHGSDLDKEPVFPICDDNAQNMVIGVAAVDSNDQKTEFSNYGKSCVDVSAPGKRILSTIGRDPITRAKSPNSYAYASGTSLAVPFVSGQAALLKALNPTATAKQIRDVILKTTEYIDQYNGSQCGGGTCAGKLGTGRINIYQSLITKMVSEAVKEGDIVEVQETGERYVILGGRRERLSSFVQQQRFGGVVPRVVPFSLLSQYPEGQYAPPLDGTLVKRPYDQTVYYMVGGIKEPVTGQVFTLWGFRFDRVITVSDAEADSWLSGKFLAPPDGTLVKTRTNPTVYWSVSGVLHPINARFYQERGLKVFPIVLVSDLDMRQFAKGEAYIR